MNKEKVKTIGIICLSIGLMISLFFGFYNHGFKKGYEGRIEKIIDFYEAWDLDVKDLYIDEWNGIKLYSDINNFSKIKNFMNELEITNETYRQLHGIAYYQNSSTKEYGYNERHQSMSCDASWDDNFMNIEIWRCDSSQEFRGKNISKEKIEMFMLGHELGHYVLEFTGHNVETGEFTEYCADDYAKKLIENEGVKDDGGF